MLVRDAVVAHSRARGLARATEHLEHSEFPDLDVSFRPHVPRARLRVLVPAGLKALAAVALGVMLLTATRTPRVYALTIAVVLVGWALVESVRARSRHDRARLGRAIVLAAVAVALVLWPSPSLFVVGRVVGIGLVAGAGLGLVQAVGRRPRRGWNLDVTGSALVLALGVGVIVVPTVLLDFVITLAGLLWLGVAGLSLAQLVAPEQELPRTFDEGWRAALRSLHGRSRRTHDRHVLFTLLFFEGDELRPRVSRFLALMAFATILATLGIAVDSTAVVIGAMLVAPLMTPLMATALAVAMGWPRRTAVSLVVALTGIGLAVGLSALIGATLPYDVPLSNPQVASRVSPTLADLFIALAAGGAGAFALSRRDISDALPGVAVAIALVPPLAVVGVTLQQGDGAAAAGAMLLFTTNLVAILLAGGTVFVATGIVPLEQLVGRQSWIRSSLALVGAAGIVVLVPLALSGNRILAEAFDRTTVQESIRAWIGDDGNEITELVVQPGVVVVRIAGPDEPSDVAALAERLRRDLGRPVELDLRWTLEERYVEGAPAPG